jgi:lipopolysaccharide export LptBFGC system permease protein LptF
MKNTYSVSFGSKSQNKIMGLVLMGIFLTFGFIFCFMTLSAPTQNDPTFAVIKYPLVLFGLIITLPGVYMGYQYLTNKVKLKIKSSK